MRLGVGSPVRGQCGCADRREQQIQVAGDVGHRADGRARVAGERLLLDRDDRRQAEHEVHVRLGHLRDEPLGVARQRLHVAALPLGVDRVERQARLAGAREPGDDDQAVARDLDRDVLQVVDARALHGDRRARGRWLPSLSPCGSSAIGGSIRVEERQLLHLDVALLRQPHRRRRLADQPLVGQVLARRGHAARRRSCRVKWSSISLARPRLADLAQVLDAPARTASARARRCSASTASSAACTRVLRLLRVEQIGVDRS